MKTKIVSYLDRKYKVANCAKFMSTDNDDGIFWFANKPEFFNGFWIPIDNLYGEAVLMRTDKDLLPEHSLKEI